MRFCFKKLDFVEHSVRSNKLAIAADDCELTWLEFYEKVGHIRNKLSDLSLPKGHPVIIYGHKESFFLASIVACMQLRLPYIPVDNIFPKERLNTIQSLTKSAVIIDCTQDELIFTKENSDTSYYRENDPIIYIMFTSGSTGVPKGVQITQQAVLSYVNWITKDFGFHSNDVFINQIPLSFDLSTYELFGFLMHGATIVSFSRETTSNPNLFVKRLANYKCTTWNSTPSFLAISLMNGDFNATQLPHLKHFYLAGEQMTHKVANRLFKSFEQSNLYNSYGPTEGCNTSTLVQITKEILDRYQTIPVGYRKHDTQINILEPMLENGNNVGEIQLVGHNISIGYFKNEELNADKFKNIGGFRAFNTGDYGYFRDDMLFFSGRKDDLVKMHGFRIELGEIDKKLESEQSIHTAVTIPLKRGTEVLRLISFVTSDDKESLCIVKEKLKDSLPYYMVPSEIILIDAFPYNTNGKIDRKELLDIYTSG